MIPGLPLTCPLAFPAGCVASPAGLRAEAQSPPHSFLRQVERQSCVSKRPPLAVGKEPGCAQNTTPDVVIQQEERPERKAKGEDIVWVQSVFAIFHIGSFYERSKNKTTAALIQYAPCRKTIRKKIRVFNKHLERL